MNQKLKNILDIIQQSEKLDAEQKENLLKAVKDADKELEITAFKLERTEKVKKTTAILLEETIEELEQKRKAVEGQNRELEIEASLERVRAVAMSMHKSDDLISICEISFKEFQKLGFDHLRNAIIHIPNDEQKYFMDYDFSELTGGAISKIEYGSHPIVDEYLKKIRSVEDAYFEVVIHKDQLKEWKDFRKNSGQMDDPRLDDATALYYYLFSIGIGDIGISAFKSIDDFQIKILKRFRNVFDLAYRRYTDIALAEAQAREAQIEAALERVRSRSIGMQKSEELREVIQVMYEQFVQLKINIDHAGFVVDYTLKGDWHFWIADERDIPSKITHPYFESVWANQFEEAKEKGLDFFTTNLNFEEKNKFYNELLSYVPGLPESSKEFYLSCPGLAATTVLFENVSLYIENFSGTPYTDEENKILMRFGKVFQQTYTRFLDLQKSEAQAREGQIQLALEKVRMVALGLNKSEEMLQVAKALYEQLLELGFSNIRNAIIDIDNKDGETFTDYDYSHEMSGTITQMSYCDDPTLEGQFKKMADTTDDFFELKLEGKELQDLVNMRLKNGEAQDTRLLNIDLLTYNLFSFGNGAIGISNFGLLNEEEKSILNRFRNVFTFAYKRYTDLAAAEAQAREAQIELALERIRARSMAIHHSDELTDVLTVLFEQFDVLGVHSKFAHLTLFDEENDTFSFRMTGLSGQRILYEQIIDINKVEAWKAAYKQWKESESDSINCIDYPPEALPQIWEIMSEIFDVLPEESKMRIEDFPNGLYTTQGHCKFGYLGFNHDRQATEEEKDIVVRFATEFGRVYQRFLDLKKAEEQAREAQIEAALERVRAIATAMQQPDELKEVAVLLRKEMGLLGVEELETSSIYLVEKDFTECWYAIKDVREKMTKLVSDHMTIQLQDTWVGREMETFHNSKQKQISIVMKGDNRKEWINYCATKSSVLQGYYGDEIPERTYHLMKFSGGYMGAASPGVISNESWNILQRSAKVFSLAYTRFKDLQQATQRAREAQIELALERVRARTMAMHKSEEIKDVVVAVMDRMNDLNIEMNGGVSLATFVPDSNDLIHWYVNPDHVDGPVTMHLPHFDNILFHDFIKARKSGKEILPVVYSFEEKNRYFEYAFEHSDFRIIPEELKQWILEQPYFGYSVAIQKHSAIFFNDYTGKLFSEKENEVLIRFSKVFDQAYIRFLDLQKAESQAREAQIEAALERVRSRTMAMQKSDELAETAAVVFQQLINLGIEPNRIYITIIKDKAGFCEFWITDEDGTKVSSVFRANLNDNQSFKKMYDGWKQNKKSITIDMHGEELQEYFRHLSTLDVPFKDGLSQIRRMQYISYFSKGFIGVASPDETKPETIQLLERFAAVFNLTYTRFNDLQQAEAQNKIIQAENERKTKELEEARQLQLAMLPKSIPEIPNLDIAVYMKTATEVGGDYYDFKVQENGVLNIGLGDATGHGLQAGTMITLMKGFFTSDVARFSPQKFLGHCNAMIRDIKLGRILMSFSHLRFNNNNLLISSAGMPPIYYHHKKNNRTEEIIIQGLPLGAMQNSSYKLVEKELNSGDTILLLTDGLPEQMNSHKVIFDYSRVLKYFDEIAENTPKDIINLLVQKANEWMDGTAQADDITFVVIMVK